MMATLSLDAACGEYSLAYCRWHCDWIECKWISDEVRYEWARIGEGIQKPIDTRV